MTKKKCNKRKSVLVIQLFLLIFSFICFAIYMDQTDIPKTSDSKDVAKSSKTSLKGNVAISNPIDFDALWEINKDVYAYLYLADSEIDYPILQHSQLDDYYLKHTIDGVESYPGSIYTEKINTKNFCDANTIIYGHNAIANGTMFNTITRYEDIAYMQTHPTIYIYTPSQILQYEVFAAYETDNTHLMNRYEYENQKDFQNFLNDVQGGEGVILNKGVKVSIFDKVITLSTCIVNGDNRFVVHAVLKKRIDCNYKKSVEVDEVEGSFNNMKGVN